MSTWRRLPDLSVGHEPELRFHGQQAYAGAGGQHPDRFPLPCTQTGGTFGLEAYVVDLEQALQTAHETAWVRLRTSEKRMKRDYVLKVYSRTFEEGDLVYVLDTATV